MLGQRRLKKEALASIQKNKCDFIVANSLTSGYAGFIFNKDGEVNPEVMTAMYLSIAELALTDKGSLTRKYKSDDVVPKKIQY